MIALKPAAMGRTAAAAVPGAHRAVDKLPQEISKPKNL